eukprot:scaffold190018_cov51-Attheya_sp.AAC.1
MSQDITCEAQWSGAKNEEKVLEISRENFFLLAQYVDSEWKNQIITQSLCFQNVFVEPSVIGCQIHNMDGV